MPVSAFHPKLPRRLPTHWTHRPRHRKVNADRSYAGEPSCLDGRFHRPEHVSLIPLARVCLWAKRPPGTGKELFRLRTPKLIVGPFVLFWIILGVRSIVGMVSGDMAWTPLLVITAFVLFFCPMLLRHDVKLSNEGISGPSSRMAPFWAGSVSRCLSAASSECAPRLSNSGITMRRQAGLLLQGVWRLRGLRADACSAPRRASCCARRWRPSCR